MQSFLAAQHLLNCEEYCDLRVINDFPSQKPTKDKKRLLVAQNRYNVKNAFVLVLMNVNNRRFLNHLTGFRIKQLYLLLKLSRLPSRHLCKQPQSLSKYSLGNAV